MKRTLCFLALFATAVVAQEGDQSTNSLFDDSEIKTYALKSIMVQGEVQNPGSVDLSQLTLRSVPIKELGLENGKQIFKGAFFVSGYSLCDILDEKQVKKVAGNTFSPLIDLYVIVENDKGEKAVFSWGEIFFTGDGSNILISKSFQAINPVKIKTTWPLPDEPRLICGNDLLNVRYVSNPTKITVKSYVGTFAAEKPENMYSPEIKIVKETNAISVGDVGSSVKSRMYRAVEYGHGMGFKGVQNNTGFLLKDIINANIKVIPDELREAVAVISAKDGYRSVYSVSEIMNRNDNKDFLLIDRKDSPGDGRYTLFAADDFFVDRNVKAVEKIEITGVK